MQEASEQTKRTIAVLSPDYLESRFSREEWTAALAEAKLLPVRVREVELSGILAVQVYIDLVGLDEPSARDRLLTEIGRQGRLKPSGKPRFPGAPPRFPGALPDVWNVPATRNRNFLGRDEELAGLQAALDSRRVVALTGLGGVGKSQLAVQLAHRCAARLDLVWWVAAEEQTTIVRDLAVLAERLGIPGDDQPAAATAAVRALEQRGRWLLIFDNVAQPAPVRSFLPQADTGWVVLTSRHAAWGPDAHAQRVGPLSTDSAVGLLESRSGHHAAPETRALADRLGGLPLALEQAGAYLEASGMAVDDYLGLLEARGKELFSRSIDPEARTVATVWETSFDQLYANHPVAADLLTLAAFLAPDDIPRTLCVGYEPLADPLAYSDALAALARYSLVIPVGDGFSVHRLVQEVTRTRLDAADRHAWAETAVEQARAAFHYKEDDPATWAGSARVLPHVLRACELALDEDGLGTEVARLLINAGSYLWRRAEYEQAELTLRRAVSVSTEAYGPRHPMVAVALVKLGMALREQRKLEGAKTAFEQAIAIDEAEYGPDHLEVAIDVNYLAQILLERGDLEDALASIKRVIAIAEDPRDAPTLASASVDLGRILKEMDDLAGAREAYARGLALNQEVYGPEHPEVATAVNHGGRLAEDQGDLEAAQRAFEEAARINEIAFGPDHPRVAIDLCDLGRVLNLRGDARGAREIVERAVAIFHDRLGPDHASTRLARELLASLPP